MEKIQARITPTEGREGRQAVSACPLEPTEVYTAGCRAAALETRTQNQHCRAPEPHTTSALPEEDDLLAQGTALWKTPG